MNALEHINRCADAHEITRKIFRQVFGHEFRQIVALVMSFAHGQPSNRQAIKGELAQNHRTVFSEIAMAGSLNNAEQRLK